MAYYRARSFFFLVLSGLIITILPLLVVLAASEVLMGRMASHSSRSVYSAVEASRLSQDTAALLLDQERKARQYYVLGDKHLLEVLEEQHRAVGDLLRRLRQVSAGAELQEKLKEIGTMEENLLSLLSHDDGKAEEILRGFVALNNLGWEIARMSGRQTTIEAEALRREAARATRVLLWLAAGLIPFSALFIAFFARLILKPIKELDRGINQLGKGDFNRPIAVSGPDDLVFLGRRLDWLRRSLAEFERNKGKIAAHVSHELKTPLASIKEGAELLADRVAGPLNAQQVEIVKILQKNSVQLQNLIENLLGYTMAQAQGTELNLGEVELKGVLEDTVDSHRVLILKKGLDVRVEGTPLTVEGDRQRLAIIIDNLFSNAIKYAPNDGHVRLTLGLVGEMALVEVYDDGPGIPEMEREAVFRPFIQGSTVCLAPVKGSGLGLAIALEYARAHGGDLVLDAESPKGTLFSLTLPVSQGG